MVQFFVFSDGNEVILFYVFPKESEVTSFFVFPKENDVISFFVFSKENEREKTFPKLKILSFWLLKQRDENSADR